MKSFTNDEAKWDFLLFLKGLTKDYTTPTQMPEGGREAFFTRVKERSLSTNQFFMAVDNRPIKVISSHCFDKYMAFQLPFSVEQYINNIHPDYLQDYLSWGKAVYSYAHQKPEILVPLQHCFRINFPLKLKDNKYYWVLMEAFPLELDENNRLISQFNAYTVLQAFDVKEKIPLVGDIWDKHFSNDTWTKELWKCRFTLQPFILTDEQRRIFTILRKNPTLSNAEVATLLGKQKNTVDVQIKQILSRARDSFPTRNFPFIREFIEFMNGMGYYEQDAMEVS